MKNIVLIGMPGAGKSTIGVILAKTLGKPFVDTDIVIQEKEQRLLQNIINEDGIDAFLRVEEKTLLGINMENHVLATGGSVVYSKAVMEHLRENGIIVYLKLDFAEIEKRLINIKTRGVAMQPGTTLRDLYNERVKLYEDYADVVIDCNGKDIETVIAEYIQVEREKS